MRALLLATLAIAACWPGRAHAQSALCVNTYLAQRRAEPTLAITPSDAERLVSRVAQSIGLTRTVPVVPCTYVEKAYAWTGKPDDKSPEGEYIIYNPDWVREVLGRDEVQAIALFGHELGHILNGDLTVRKDLPRQQLERDADRFAGCAVARLSGDFARLEDLLSRLRLDKDALYPDRLTSIESAKAGFAECKITQAPPTEVKGRYAVVKSQWDAVHGDWQFDDGKATQLDEGVHPGLAVIMGSEQAREFAFDARRISGTDGFSVVVSYQRENLGAWWDIGGFGGSKSIAEFADPGGGVYRLPQTDQPFAIKTNEWYAIHVERSGRHIVGTINGQIFLDFELPQNIEANGKLGFRTWSSRMEFRNVSVR